MVRWRCFSNSVGGASSTTTSSPESSSITLRHKRCRNRCIPTTSRVFQGLLASRGPMAISYKRNVSAPNSSYISSGVTMFFRLLPIFPYSRKTVSPFHVKELSDSTTSAAGTVCPRASRYAYAWIYPWLYKRWNGSSLETWPRSCNTLCQKRAYSRCNTACSTPPTYRSTPPVWPGSRGPIQ